MILDSSKPHRPWAVVTGASSGIGEAFARQLAVEGYHLVLVARREGQLQSLAVHLYERHGVRCVPVAVDVASATFLDTLRRETDGLEVELLVSNAGTATALEFIRWDSSELAYDLAVNTTAHVTLAHHFAARMAARGRGGVLLVSSIAGRQPIPFLASYSAAKSFVSVLGESLHDELKPRGVNVTVLVAGPTDTALRTSMGFGRSRLKPMSPAQCAREGLTALRLGKASHISGRKVRLMLWLMPRKVLSRILGRVVGGFARERLTSRDRGLQLPQNDSPSTAR